MLSSGDQTNDLVRKIYFAMLSITLAFNFNLLNKFFLQVDRKFLVHRVHQKFAFLTRLTAYTWIQNISW